MQTEQALIGICLLKVYKKKIICYTTILFTQMCFRDHQYYIYFKEAKY